MIVDNLFYCSGYIPSINVAWNIGPKNGTRRGALFIKMMLLMLFGPGALCGASLAIALIICWSVISQNLQMGGG